MTKITWYILYFMTFTVKYNAFILVFLQRTLQLIEQNTFNLKMFNKMLSFPFIVVHKYFFCSYDLKQTGYSG